MATATVHKLPEAEPIDPHTCVLQASGLLYALVRNFNGEVPAKDRASAEEVFFAIEAASQLLGDSLRARPENVEASRGGAHLNALARKALRCAHGSLRVVGAAAFITEPNAQGPAIEQALTDEALLNAIWAVSASVETAKVAWA